MKIQFIKIQSAAVNHYNTLNLKIRVQKRQVSNKCNKKPYSSKTADILENTIKMGGGGRDAGLLLKK